MNELESTYGNLHKMNVGVEPDNETERSMLVFRRRPSHPSKSSNELVRILSGQPGYIK